MAQTYKKDFLDSADWLFCFFIFLSSPRFVRSGGFYLDNGSVGGPHSGNMGNNGQFWSSRAYSEAGRAYNLNFNVTGVNPSNNNYRWAGFPLRRLDSSRRVPIF